MTKAVCAVIIIDGKSIVKLQIETAFSSECEHVLSIFLTNSPIPGENGIFQQAELSFALKAAIAHAYLLEVRVAEVLQFVISLNFLYNYFNNNNVQARMEGCARVAEVKTA